MGVNFSVTGSTIKGSDGPVITTGTRMYLRYLPSGFKTSLRHLQIVLKLSYLDKTYIRCPQDNLIENNCKSAHKFILSMSMQSVRSISYITENLQLVA